MLRNRNNDFFLTRLKIVPKRNLLVILNSISNCKNITPNRIEQKSLIVQDKISIALNLIFNRA